MEKRRVTVYIGNRPYSFYSDDPDEYIAALEKRANEALRQAGRLSGSMGDSGAVLAVILLTDRLMRAEQAEPPKQETPEPPKRKEPKENRKSAQRATEEDKRQISVWDLMKEKRPER